MAKEKSKRDRGPPNKHLAARITFLQQAALHLAVSQSMEDSQTALKSSGQFLINVAEVRGPAMKDDSIKTLNSNDDLPNGSAAHMALELRQVALKSQIRLQPSIKHFSCKSCHTVLLEGRTCRKYTENLSRGGKKPHADVMVQECMTCGTKKRFPMNAVRQSRKSMRTLTLPEETTTPNETPLVSSGQIKRCQPRHGHTPPFSLTLVIAVWELRVLTIIAAMTIVGCDVVVRSLLIAQELSGRYIAPPSLDSEPACQFLSRRCSILRKFSASCNILSMVSSFLRLPSVTCIRSHSAGALTWSAAHHDSDTRCSALSKEGKARCRHISASSFGILRTPEA